MNYTQRPQFRGVYSINLLMETLALYLNIRLTIRFSLVVAIQVVRQYSTHIHNNKWIDLLS